MGLPLDRLSRSYGALCPDFRRAIPCCESTPMRHLTTFKAKRIDSGSSPRDCRKRHD